MKSTSPSLLATLLAASVLGGGKLPGFNEAFEEGTKGDCPCLGCRVLKFAQDKPAKDLEKYQKVAQNVGDIFLRIEKLANLNEEFITEVGDVLLEMGFPEAANGVYGLRDAAIRMRPHINLSNEEMNRKDAEAPASEEKVG